MKSEPSDNKNSRIANLKKETASRRKKEWHNTRREAVYQLPPPSKI